MRQWGVTYRKAGMYEFHDTRINNSHAKLQGTSTSNYQHWCQNHLMNNMVKSDNLILEISQY